MLFGTKLTWTIKLNLLLIFVVVFLSLRVTYYSVEVLSRVTLVKDGAHYCEGLNGVVAFTVIG